MTRENWYRAYHIARKRIIPITDDIMSFIHPAIEVRRKLKDSQHDMVVYASRGIVGHSTTHAKEFIASNLTLLSHYGTGKFQLTHFEST